MSINVPQTSVDATMEIGLEGQLADFQSNADAIVDTGISEEASAAIPFGFFVQKGTNQDGVKLPTGATTPVQLRGISVHGHSFERKTELFDDGLQPKAVFGVLQRGRVFVKANTDVVVGDEVHVCIDTHSGYEIGRCGKDGQAGDTIDITAFARWVRGGLKGSVVVLEIDMNNAALGSAD